MQIDKTPDGFSWNGKEYEEVVSSHMCSGCAFNVEKLQICRLLEPNPADPMGDVPLDLVQAIFGGRICIDKGMIYREVTLSRKTIMDHLRDMCR